MSESMTVMEVWIAMLQVKGFRVEEDRIANCTEFMGNYESNEDIYKALGFSETVRYIYAKECPNGVLCKS